MSRGDDGGGDDDDDSSRLPTPTIAIIAMIVIISTVGHLEGAGPAWREPRGGRGGARRQVKLCCVGRHCGRAMKLHTGCRSCVGYPSPTQHRGVVGCGCGCASEWFAYGMPSHTRHRGS